MMEKIENITKDLTRKDREIVTYETKLQSFGEQLKKKEKASEDKAKEQQEEKNDYNNKLEELRLKTLSVGGFFTIIRSMYYHLLRDRHFNSIERMVHNQCVF